MVSSKNTTCKENKGTCNLTWSHLSNYLIKKTKKLTKEMEITEGECDGFNALVT